VITVVVADDHPIVREGLRAVLAVAPDLRLVGEGADGRQALALVRRLRPAVLLLDLDLPGLDGLAVVRAMRHEGLATAALLFTAYDSDPRLTAALRDGACGCLLKGAPRHHLFAAVRTAAAGGRVVPPELGGRLLAEVQAGGRPTLTPRQGQVLALVAAGCSNAEIAARLGIGPRTAKYHVAAVLARLGARNRAEAVRRALAAGLLPPA
jgi:DNA-binding NarL/FixJ family response regulator